MGTTFAFLVKACLGIAISAAYTQLFWHATAGKRTSLYALDALGSATTNILHLFRFPIWMTYPLMLPLALLLW